jgi:peptide/nickel transport system substrate-binding protein
MKTAMMRMALLCAVLSGLWFVPQQAAYSQSFYNEAPMLAARVAAGDLPIVDERMPINPMLIQPVEQVGHYGGTLEVIVSEAGNTSSVIGYEPLVRWDAEWLRVIPNVAQSVDSSADATAYTFRLREGMRWSDGEPFTANDIVFWYEAIFTNPELTPRPPTWLTSGGMPVVVEKVDNYTVTFRFAEPNGFFLYEMANARGDEPNLYARHYLEQYHKDYNPNIDDLITSEGVADWVELFQRKAKTGGNFARSPCPYNNELPSLKAWTVIEQGDMVIAERNPYYWKIDTDFNQLPYIDQVKFIPATSLDEFAAIINDGAAHLVMENDFGNFDVRQTEGPALLEVTLVSSYSTNYAIGLNVSHPDPFLREIFLNKDFRIGLSHAMNRQRIIDDVFGGEGEPYQAAPRPESPFYDENFAHQYTEYNVELANQYLDQAGYAEHDADGFRLGPDGRRIAFTLQTNTLSENTRAMLNDIIEDWRAVGVDVSLEVFEGDNAEAFNGLLFSNTHNNYNSEGVGGLDVIQQPVYYFPYHQYASFWASGWGYWYKDPTNALTVEPPVAVQQQMALYDQLRGTVDIAEQEALMGQILAIAADEFYVIGTILDPNTYMLISPNLHNVPSVMPRAFTYPTPAPSNPAQYYIE